MADDATIIRCLSCNAGNRVRPTSAGTPRCAKCKTPLPWLVNATSETFAAEVDAKVPVVVDFWAEWCGPCRMVGPVLEKLAKKNAGELKVVKVDVDAHPDLGQRFGAQSIPLMVLMSDGKEADRIVGAAPESALSQWVAPHIAAAKA